MRAVVLLANCGSGGGWMPAPYKNSVRIACRVGLCAVILVGAAACSGDSDPVVTAAMRERAAAGPGVGAMLTSLERILAWHTEHGTAIPELLEPGLDDATIDARFREIGCEAPADLRALWRWRNGHGDNGEAQWLAWYHQFLSLDEALDERRKLRLLPFYGWGRHWIPVLQFQTEWYFVVCGPTPRAASPLLVFFPEDGFAHPYTSLASYFETMARAMDSGAVYAEGNPLVMGVRIRELAAIHAANNPGLAFPYYVGD